MIRDLLPPHHEPAVRAVEPLTTPVTVEIRPKPKKHVEVLSKRPAKIKPDPGIALIQ